ncbi:MAG: quinone-interacting membrane-bound oxidoreductase complex subunit QmoC [Desulfobacterales bacterium]|nr:quinone-interacting membrane-bound oxidoreductase complex subunit QmoC [Desulfobacterales bacterium]MDX2511594.1 quinone-interacting membrane-bound oxidoreductase complex subunit QmoC [Desulfobacterales bacterium]
MADAYVIEPDVGFIHEVKGLGGGDLKKCFQCATCSVACPISPDNKPFPRKEMIAASWGLKDKLVGNGDVWLCHNCGDCTTLCPRGAKPGDVLGAIRAYAVTEYGPVKAIGKLINDPKKLPIVLGIPALLFLVLGLITGLLNFHPEGDKIVHAHFFSTWLVDMVMIPAAIWAVINFALGLKRFLNDMHQNALQEGKTDIEKIDPKGLVMGLVRMIPAILKHDKFNECSENKDRATAHMMVLFGFIGLFIVTNIFFVAIYGLQIHGPYSQMNPVKWLGNVSGVALIIGSILMIRSRLSKKDQVSAYKDWWLVGWALALGVTGMTAQVTRLLGLAGLSYTVYYIHLMFIWSLFFFIPYSKLAHLVYRTTALAYNEYIGRK